MDYAIIAAGEGSRLVEEGVTTPKPLVRLLGEPMIDRLMGLFLRHGATSISVIVNEEMTDVQHHMEQLALPVPLNLVVRSTPSSMHSFHALRPFLTSDTCCLTTVDTVFREEPFAAYIDAFERSPLLDGMMAVTAYVDDEAPLYVRTDSAASTVRRARRRAANTSRAACTACVGRRSMCSIRRWSKASPACATISGCSSAKGCGSGPTPSIRFSTSTTPQTSPRPNPSCPPPDYF